jgi:hypothetical protein
MAEILSPIVKRSLEDFRQFCKQLQDSTAVNFQESVLVQDERKKKALKDYQYFVTTYFAIYADAECADFQIKAANNILKGFNKINILEWAREHAKSVHADVIIPMWLLIHGELDGMILMGKDENDACNLLSDVQAQLQSNQLFIHDWGTQFSFGDWADGDFTTKNGIRFLAVGRGQSPRGARKGEKRPNYGVVDDVDDDTIVNNQRLVLQIVKRILGALLFALATKKWRLVVAGNRISSQSILAHIVGDISPRAPKRDNIFHSKVCAAYNKLTGQPSSTPLNKNIDIPAWHQRYTIEDLNTKILAAGIYGRTEFFHENVVVGKVFRDEMFQWKPMLKHTWRNYDAIIGYCDPSFENKATSDTKAVRVWGFKNGNKHILKSFVRRCDMNDVYDFMSAMDDELPPGVGIVWRIEKQFFNRPVADALLEHNKKRKREKKRYLVIIRDDRTKENKFTRIIKMQPAYANRLVYFNIDEMHNSDMIDGNNQLKGIEPGYRSADDAPDADEGAWYYGDMHLPGRDFKPTFGKRTEKSLY